MAQGRFALGKKSWGEGYLVSKRTVGLGKRKKKVGLRDPPKEGNVLRGAAIATQSEKPVKGKKPGKNRSYWDAQEEVVKRIRGPAMV